MCGRGALLDLHLQPAGRPGLVAMCSLLTGCLYSGNSGKSMEGARSGGGEGGRGGSAGSRCCL